MDWAKLCQDVGIATGLVGAGILLLFFLTKWILEQFKTELEGNRKERIQYLEILHKLGAGIDEHNLRSKEFMSSVAKEHQEMILALGRINGYKH